MILRSTGTPPPKKNNRWITENHTPLHFAMRYELSNSKIKFKTCSSLVYNFDSAYFKNLDLSVNNNWLLLVMLFS